MVVLLLGFDNNLLKHQGLDVFVVDISVSSLMVNEGSTVVAWLGGNDGHSNVSVDEFGGNFVDLKSVEVSFTIGHLNFSVAHDGLVAYKERENWD